MVRDNNLLVKVWTGTYGILRLAGEQGIDWNPTMRQGAFRWRSETNFDAKWRLETVILSLYSCRYYWKIVYDFETHFGVAFVQINNPHLAEVTPDDIICGTVTTSGMDLCDKVPWLGISQKERTARNNGYLYCCEVHDFMRSVPSAPQDIQDTQMEHSF